MRIKIRFFSIYRDIIGKEQIVLESSDAIAIDSLIDELIDMYPRLKKIFSEIKPLILVNGSIVDETYVVSDDAEIAIIPPVSGGGERIKVGFFSKDNDLNIDKELSELIASIDGEGIGAIAIFIGIVKDYIENIKVNELIYEAYEPYASKYLEKIAREELGKGRIRAIRIRNIEKPSPIFAILLIFIVIILSSLIHPIS